MGGAAGAIASAVQTVQLHYRAGGRRFDRGFAAERFTWVPPRDSAASNKYQYFRVDLGDSISPRCWGSRRFVLWVFVGEIEEWRSNCGFFRLISESTAMKPRCRVYAERRVIFPHEPLHRDSPGSRQHISAHRRVSSEEGKCVAGMIQGCRVNWMNLISFTVPFGLRYIIAMPNAGGDQGWCGGGVDCTVPSC